MSTTTLILIIVGCVCGGFFLMFVIYWFGLRQVTPTPDNYT